MYKHTIMVSFKITFNFLRTLGKMGISLLAEGGQARWLFWCPCSLSLSLSPGKKSEEENLFEIITG